MENKEAIVQFSILCSERTHLEYENGENKQYDCYETI